MTLKICNMTTHFLIFLGLLLHRAAAVDDPLPPPLEFNGVQIYNYHIHVYFLQRNNASAARALSLREDFRRRFLAPGAAACAHEVNRDRACVWAGVNWEPEGPHTYGSWGASLTNTQYNDVLPWVIANQQQQQAAVADGNRTSCGGEQLCFPQRGALAGILVHPLTADRGVDTRASRRLDHQLGLWTGGTGFGGVLPIDFDFLYHNVYDCSVCDPESCMQAC